MEIIEYIVVTFLTTFTVLQAFEKWGWIDAYAVYREKWMPAAECHLCLGFWLSIIVAVVYWLAKRFDIEFLFVPFCCAGILNFLSTYLKILKGEGH